MKMTRGLAPIVWLIIAAIVLGGGYILVSGKFKVKNEKQEVTKEETNDEFTDWKTYRNEKYGFEFKLPGDFNISRHDERGNEYIDTYRHQINADQYFSVHITPVTRIRELARTLTGTDYSKQPIILENIIAESRSYNTYLDKNTKNKINQVVDGIVSIRQEERSIDDNGTSIFFTTYLLKDNLLVRLIMSPRLRADSATFDEKLYNQILSTFRFTK